MVVLFSILMHIFRLKAELKHIIISALNSTHATTLISAE